jgi:Glycosyltransferase like family
MNWTVICATNNDQVLKSCLLNSPDIRGASEVILKRGYKSAAAAYNSGLQKAKTDLVVLIHQDVYLPKGWIDSLQAAVESLSISDPEWGVLGVWGGIDAPSVPGYMYWTGVDGTAGEPFDGVHEVRSLDEVVLILRKSSGLWFDERLPGFHMYGTDICLEARRRGRKCYVFSGFCVHNTNVYDLLPMEFWRNCLFVRKKWKSELPINTPCIDITWSCWPMIRWNLLRGANIILRRHRPGKRVADPVALYEDLVNRGLVVAPARVGVGSKAE